MGTRLPLSAYRAISTTEPDVALQLLRMRQPCCHEITPLVSRDWKLAVERLCHGQCYDCCELLSGLLGGGAP